MVTRKKKSQKEKIVVGWREWVALPDLGLVAVKAKIDTGAKTSTLHTFEQKLFIKDGIEYVRFGMHPHQERKRQKVYCEAPVFDKRIITDSGGHKENRLVIKTEMYIGEHHWPIELTLTNRETMTYRMLIGRAAMVKKFLVNPSRSFLTGKELGEVYKSKIDKK